MATALEIYVKGSLNLFNHRTNVDIDNRFVCYDIRELGKQLKKIGDAGGTGCRLGPRNYEPLRRKNDQIFYRRVPSLAS